jgi:hypothetical protein
MELKLFRFRYINILREIIDNNFPFPPEFGRPKASIFRSRGVPGRLDALLAKSLHTPTYHLLKECFQFDSTKPHRVRLGTLLSPCSNSGAIRDGGSYLKRTV